MRQPTSPTTRRIPDVVAYGAFALLAAFTFVDKGPSRALQWPWYLYAQVLPLLPVVWLVARGFTERRLLRFGGMLDVGLLGFAGVTTAAALLSPERATCVAMLPIILVPVTVAYAVRNWVEAPDRDARMQRLSLLFGYGLGIASTLALLLWFWDVVVPACGDGQSWGTALSNRNESLLGHAVYNAGLGVLTVGWLGGLAFGQQGVRKLLLAAGAAIGFALVLAAASRSGFVGVGIWLAWLVGAETRKRQWSPARTATVLLLCLGAAVTVFALQPRSRLIFQLWRESRTFNTGDVGRLAMAEFGTLVLKDHPVLGIGAGATPLVYPLYRARLVGGWETALQLHSTPVQWAADAGLAGIITIGTIAVALFRRRWRQAPSFASGALLAYLGLGLTDYQLDLPVFAFGAGTLVGLLGLPAPAGTPRAEAGHAPSPRSTVPRATLAAITLTTLLAAYAYSQLDSVRARSAFAGGITALSDGDPATFTAQMAEAHRLDPRNIHYLNLHACILADIAAYPGWFPALDLGSDHRERALDLFRRSLLANPGQELPHTHLAWYLLPTEPAEAAKHFCAAARIIPDKGSIYFGLGLALLQQRHSDEAARALAMELVSDPAFVASPEWIQLESVPGLAVTARHLAADQLERIGNATATQPAAAHQRRALYAAALLRWLGGDDTALAAALAHAEPLQREMLEWLAGRAVATDAPARHWHALARAAAEASESGPGAERSAQPPSEREAVRRVLRTADRRQLVVLSSAAPALPSPSTYRTRPGYGLLMRNVDAPAPRDPYIAPTNRLVRDFLAPLFPEKGFLPAPELVGAATDLNVLRPLPAS